MVTNITTGNNIEEIAAKKHGKVNRRSILRRVVHLFRRTGKRAKLFFRLITPFLFRTWDRSTIRLANAGAAIQRCCIRLAAKIAVISVETIHCLISLYDFSLETRLGKKMPRITKESMINFGQKQLATVCCFSTITLAVMAGGIIVPVNNVGGIVMDADTVAADAGTLADSTLTDVLQSNNQSYTISLQIGTENVYSVSARNHTTVGTLLAGEGIILGSDDTLNVSPADEITGDMSIILTRVTFSEAREETQTVPYETVSNPVQYLPKGESHRTKCGVDGSCIATVRDRYENGVLVSTEEISRKITKEPVNEEINLGVGGTITDANGKSYSYSYYIDVIATAYGTNYDGATTATGTKPKRGTIAVDPTLIDLGSKVYVEGQNVTGYDGVYTAEDTGGNIKGQIIDIYMDQNLQEMIQFGAKDMRVYILE